MRDNKRPVLCYFFTLIVLVNVGIIVILSKHALVNNTFNIKPLSGPAKSSNYSSDTFNQAMDPPPEPTYFRRALVTNVLNLSFDEECKANGEWENLNRVAFIKRTGVFYFTDSDEIVILVVSSQVRRYAFDVELRAFEYLPDEDQFKFVLIHIFVDASVKPCHDGQEYHFVRIFCNVTSIKENFPDPKHLRLQLTVTDQVSKATTINPLDVKIKTLDRDRLDKRGAIVCMKTARLRRADYLSFKWWLELHKEVGYTKIFMSNHSIENHPLLNELFTKNKDFVELVTLKCVPNLQNAEDAPRHFNFTYLKSYLDLKKNGIHSWPKFEIPPVALMNECYLDNIDKYKYVGIYDLDEIVLPRKLANFDQNTDYVLSLGGGNITKKEVMDNIKCDRYANETVKTPIESYLAGVQKHLGGGTPFSMFFFYTFYTPNSVVEQVMNSIEQTLTRHANLSQEIGYNKSQPLNYTIYCYEYSGRFRNNVSFSLLIYSQDDLKYASNLLKIYRNVVKPLLDEKSKVMNNTVLQFDRLFSFGFSRLSSGKSVHDTWSTIGFAMHTPHYNRGFRQVSPHLGQMAHFRGEMFGFQFVDLHHHYQRTPIREFQLDFNYLNCYFLPMLKRLGEGQ